MDYLRNHCWCSSSNWNGVVYTCQHMVSLNSFKEGYRDDWESLIDPKADTIFQETDYDAMAKTLLYKGLPPLDQKHFHKNVKNLKPHVLKWLHENVPDRKDFECNKGWCIGSLKYRSEDSSISFSVFFHRRSDAMNFIKKFSKWGKPISYCQYFKDVRKTLDLTTLEYTRT